jgi:multidrug transporter EmrE-like cation transporter
MTFLLLALAACAFVVGGMSMKWSEGFQNPYATAGVFAAFCLGAALQTYAMRYEALGVGYVLVLGMEAALAVLAGVLFFGETMAWRNWIGVTLVVSGIFLLKSTH